jgi:long-chain acyl-CoA synthetase
VPDKKQGEKVIAWMVRDSTAEVSDEEIRLWCRDRLVNYKVPTEIYFREHLPRTGVGKILHRELIREYLEKETS